MRGSVVDDAGLRRGESGANSGEAFRASFEGVLILLGVFGVRLAWILRQVPRKRRKTYDVDVAGRREVLGIERGLARSRRTDKDDDFGL